MRNLVTGIAASVGLVLLSAPGALVFSGVAQGQESSEEAASLDSLFDQLRYAPDEMSASAIDRQIWMHWTTPSDPVLASRMAEIMRTRSSMNLQGAIGMLDDLVVDYPEYAEAWNQRATIHFMLGNLESSLADIDKVLEFEPRHFGALSGQALIHRQMGNEPQALRSMSRALDIHPFLAERHLFPGLLDGVTRL